LAILGAHQSIAGGYYKAVELGRDTGCQIIQIFTKNTNQWRGKPITPEESQQFRDTLVQTGIACPVAHDSYLINLASPNESLWGKSIAAMIDEVQRAGILGIPWVVSHPGAYTTTSESEGLQRIIAALDQVIEQSSRHSPSAVRPESETSESGETSGASRTADGTRSVPATVSGILLETTAGQGTTLGWRFEHLAEILSGVKDNARLGVCFDTCHVFAAGYKMSTQAEYRAMMKEFDKVIGTDRIRAFHLNDSVKDCGSRVDRHAHIGLGKIGREPFGWFVRDPRWRDVPMVLETPKAQEDGEDYDVINLRVLRELACGGS